MFLNSLLHRVFVEIIIILHIKTCNFLYVREFNNHRWNKYTHCLPCNRLVRPGHNICVNKFFQQTKELNGLPMPSSFNRWYICISVNQAHWHNYHATLQMAFHFVHHRHRLHIELHFIQTTELRLVPLAPLVFCE